MRNFLFFIPLVFLQLACSSPTATRSNAVNEYLDNMFQEQLERDPQFRTYVGEKQDYDQLTNISEKAQKETFERDQQHLAALNTFLKAGPLDETTAVSLEVAKVMKEQAVESYPFRHHYYPVNQMFGEQSELPSFMINMHRVESYDDAKAYVERLNKFPWKFDQLINNLETAAKKGIIPPKFIYEKAYRDIQNIVTGFPFTRSKEMSPLWKDFTVKLDKVKVLENTAKKELLDQAEKALKEKVGLAYKNLGAALRKLEKRAPKLGTASNLPKGNEFYEVALRQHTTTSLSAEEIHQLGLKEVERIHEEMRDIMAKIDPKFKDLSQFFNHLKTSVAQKFPNTKEGKEAYLAKAKEYIDTMKEKLPSLFNRLPEAEIIVKAVEPYREQSAGLAFYEGPSEDGKRPATYYVNLYDMDSVLKYEMEALAYHEGIPGHHMQIAIATEMDELPRFRKYTWFTSYGEGWALYAELIPKEIGLYQELYSDFGRLSMELWRACRLVVDTGLHAKGWSRQKAADYLLKNTPSTKADAMKAAERYIVMPGQATAYKIGMIRIQQLRKQAKAKLGDRFDIREFHDLILKNGTVPLSVLEKQVERWVESKS